MERLQDGKFQLRDMREQYESVLSLGPLSKVGIEMGGCVMVPVYVERLCVCWCVCVRVCVRVRACACQCR